MLLHPLGGATSDVFWSQYLRSRPFSPSSLPQRMLAFVSLATRSPFYALERFTYGQALESQEIEAGPIFIVGHWRSGTTYLHNLMAVDDQFGYLNVTQMVTPNDVLLSRYIPLIPFLLRLHLPKTRGIDSVKLTVESPQEEEITLGILSGISYYNCYYFPNQFEEHYRKAIGLTELSQRELRRFGQAYRQLVRKLTYVHGGKPLVFKNPCSTSRLLFLKQLFPSAKFVHIRRNPYQVFASSRARLPRMIKGLRWQDGNGLDYDKLTIDGYRLLMEQYLEQRDQIPSEDLFETSYEELTAAPEETVARIYDVFGLERPESARRNLQTFLDSQKDYQGSKHRLTRQQLERVEKEWAFAFEEWDYGLPEDVMVEEPEAAMPV